MYLLAYGYTFESRVYVPLGRGCIFGWRMYFFGWGMYLWVEGCTSDEGCTLSGGCTLRGVYAPCAYPCEGLIQAIPVFVVCIPVTDRRLSSDD